MILRLPIYEMDMMISRLDMVDHDVSEVNTVSELRKRAAKNVYASIDGNNGFKGPKILIYAYDCECKIPYLLMEFNSRGQDLEDELAHLNNEDVRTVSDMWARDALVYQNIVFDGPGKIIAHEDLLSRDWPCSWTGKTAYERNTNRVGRLSFSIIFSAVENPARCIGEASHRTSIFVL